MEKIPPTRKMPHRGNSERLLVMASWPISVKIFQRSLLDGLRCVSTMGMGVRSFSSRFLR